MLDRYEIVEKRIAADGFRSTVRTGGFESKEAAFEEACRRGDSAPETEIRHYTILRIG